MLTLPPDSGCLLSAPELLVDGQPALDRWVEVLVDCPGAQGLFTYQLLEGVAVQPGDILSVPFGAQQVGAIAIRCLSEFPAGLELAQIRPIEAVIQAGFFPPTYWQLLQRVAQYYHTPLMQVVRAALPAGLLSRSQRRIRLVQPPPLMADGSLLSAKAQAILSVLQASKAGDYSWQYVQRQVNGAHQELQELLKAGWVESYLEPPSPVRPKQRQAVTLTARADSPTDLTSRQQDVIGVLRRQGGELWMADLLQHSQTSSTTLKNLAQKGYLTIQPREVLRTEAGIPVIDDRPKALTADQASALTVVQGLTGTAEVLLHGVTGSGKTEVYLQAIAPRLQQGQSALVLVPEIGLTPQLTDRFRARFGDRVRVYHSALSEGERYDTWRQMLGGTPQVVIGTRSAIFAPLPHLGLIILDEEHDSSFKQDQPAPCYHARTVARWRSELANCPLLLGSATPALESWVRSQESGIRESQEESGDRKPLQDVAPNVPEFLASSPHPPISLSHRLSLPARVHAQPMPTIAIVDMRQELHQGNRSLFSRSLQDALRTLPQEGNQAILFVPRRGHSTFVSCRSCGYVVTCPHCDVSLTYHQPQADSVPLLRCHYCNYLQSQPKTCPSCDSGYFKHFGSGTQRVMQELGMLFPSLRVLRFDSDTTRAKGAHRSLLTRFAEGDADVLVGTQMLTKGIDLPQVTLVGIVAADGLLHLADYAASERTFQVLTQVAGRCGRGDRPGRVMLQTYSPENPVIQAVQRQDYAAFVQAELHQRSQLRYPPYGRLVLLRFASPQAVAVQQAAERVAMTLATHLPPSVERLGPAPATILRVAGRYRWQLLLKFPPDTEPVLPDPAALRALCPANVSLLIDIDPLSVG
ncbi:MAG: primosomal protein N' [Leptolyngbyaceae cyanobacterium bins.302]|nr:primosomal protein N' [Leptolyngbyaceae cyanobacterium bins.302]